MFLTHTESRLKDAYCTNRKKTGNVKRETEFLKEGLGDLGERVRVKCLSEILVELEENRERGENCRVQEITERKACCRIHPDFKDTHPN